MNKTNILLLNSVLTGGGAEHVIATLARNFDKNIFNVYIGYIQHGGIIQEQLEREGYQVLNIQQTPSSTLLNTSIAKLSATIKKYDIQIIHTHDIRSLVDVSLCRLTNRKIKHVHTFHYGNYPRKEKKHHYLEKIFINFPTQLISVGDVQKENIIKSYNISGAIIKTIWNGVDPIKPAINKDIEKKIKRSGKHIIGSISTLIEQKGVEYLLEAVAELRKTRDDFIMVIAGSGYLKDALIQRTKELKIEDVTFFTGWVDDASESVLPLFEIFVQSSLWEAMSMVILEAMASQKAIVATTVGENSKVLTQDKTGILVSPKDPIALKKSLEKLLADEKTRSSMAMNAYEAYYQKFTGRIMAKNYEELYAKLLN